ncbi:uncharacterized protein TRIVIDRAFT_223032 [Trichoderma virens Gv29-8]|uniref:DUF4470 domain-containing protein n=1 Tax=Hypocrea virens (strain Gv29-8 / FGSC 10586) TaxID=413071 RepID=G9MVU5_HYPVG|nr:uncharacterized protein TRIVIDRAFT_223032 [Trichoderma virens Gv29-8]EHK21420.1 hypothetical protein TRIVIDRAFT_223032 [Trichoderma virens Gv29-8]UKZ53374.1 hypothetical protein TrVGV298_007166 [Trichoderma virens]
MSTNDETGGIPDHPFLDNPSFWSPYAASDILNLAANEGPEYDGPLRLLLIGAFGLRHLIYSFVAMPETANPLLYVTINEFSKPDIMRTFLSLLILSEEEADDLEAAEAVIHVWYSVKWSKQTQSYIDKRVRRLLAGIYTKVQSYYGDDEDMRAECFAVKFGTPGYLTLDAFFDWHTWDYVLETYFADEDVEIMNREADVLACGEAFDRIRRTMSPSRAAALMKWRLDGILVPYGQSSSSYTKPNPTFFPLDRKGVYGITREPLSEWPMNEILDYSPYIAKNDVYGKMKFYLRQKVITFRARLKKKGMLIKLMNCPLNHMAGHIPKYHHETPNFDRIEVGTIFETLPELCFVSCAPLLRHSDENPSATMLTMCRDVITTAEVPETRQLLELEKYYLYYPTIELVETMEPRRLAFGEQYSTALLPRHLLLVHQRNWQILFYNYLHDVKHFGLRVPGDDKSQQPVASIMITGYLGLSAKHLNTIVNQWPNVLCWLEWKKTRDVSPKEWFKYLEMSTRDEESVRMWKRTYGCLSWEQRTRNKVKEEAEMTQRIVRTKMPKKHDNEASDGNDADGEESSDVACQAEQTHSSHGDVEGNDDGELETTLHDGEMKNEKNQDLTE